jgi:hypothetical protein
METIKFPTRRPEPTASPESARIQHTRDDKQREAQAKHAAAAQSSKGGRDA